MRLALLLALALLPAVGVAQTDAPAAAPTPKPAAPKLTKAQLTAAELQNRDLCVGLAGCGRRD